MIVPRVRSDRRAKAPSSSMQYVHKTHPLHSNHSTVPMEEEDPTMVNGKTANKMDVAYL